MNRCPQMPLSGQRHIKGIYQREDVQNETTKVNAFCYFMPYILNIHRPPRWVIRSVWGNFPRENCKCLSTSGIRQPFFVWCSYRSLSTRGSWWGASPLRSVFNYFYSCGTVQKDNSKPHTHLRCPPVPFDRHSVAEKDTQRLYIGNLIITTP